MMPKHPLRGHTDAPKASDTHSETVPKTQLAGALVVTAFRFVESAERARSWIGRLFQHLVVSVDLPSAKTPALRSPRLI